MRVSGYRYLIALLLIGWGCPALAASDAPVDQTTIEMNRKANEACYACHSAAGIAKPPKADIDMSKLKDSRLEPMVYNPSDHGVMDCRECHSKTHYTDYPHAEAGKRETVGCTDCHAAKVLRLEPQFNASVHAKVQGVKEKFTCFTCHNPHINIVQKRLKDPAKIVAQDNHGCLECHNSSEMFAKFAPEGEKTPGLKKARPDIDTIHDWLPNAKAHWQSVRCIECHTPAVAENKMLSHEILDKEKSEKKCLSCHSANSTLKARLYRHMVKDEQQKYGFTNSVLLSNSYIIGATRHPLLDSIIIALVIATLLGVLLHGAIRIVMSLRRKKEESQ
ncbi:MAG: cytochrome c3 family protein [Rhodocyclaceae bacterium]|nr:cytochrome c3 family protein [Rhodocyclaceae bacterium]